MTTETTEQQQPIVEMPVKQAPIDASEETSAIKRPFEEIQARATTILDLEDDEDEAADLDYEEEDEETDVETPATASSAKENADGAIESETDDDEAVEADEEITMEELTHIVKEAGFDVDIPELSSRILRTGKKISTQVEEASAAAIEE
jgi:hypothetical protein